MRTNPNELRTKGASHVDALLRAIKRRPVRQHGREPAELADRAAVELLCRFTRHLEQRHQINDQ